MRLLVEELTHCLLNSGHARHAADQDNLGYVAHCQPGILQCLAAWLDGTLHQVFGQLLQLGAAQRQVHVLGAGGVGGDEGQI